VWRTLADPVPAAAAMRPSVPSTLGQCEGRSRRDFGRARFADQRVADAASALAGHTGKPGHADRDLGRCEIAKEISDMRDLRRRDAFSPHSPRRRDE
jgi:hypothetical protein